MFNQYPYININDFNLDWVIEQIRKLKYDVTNFVSINAIKYADPIQWDIVRQYEKNTVVIDPLTGTAYISVAPVPSGVALTRPEYWTVVFDLGSFVVRAAKNFSDHYEAETTLTATFSSNTGDWLVWGDTLYKALVNITAGDTYVVDSNIKHFTIEEIYNDYLNVVSAILAMIGDLSDLTTSDTSDLVHAINSVLDDINLTIGDLSNLITSDTSDIVHAINAALTDANDYTDSLTGVLSNLTTSNQDNLVDAINEVVGNVTTNTSAITQISEDIQRIHNVIEYGADPTGINDSAAAFQAACNAGEMVYIPAGRYYIGTPIDLAFTNKVHGDGVNTTMIEFDENLSYLFNCAGRHTFNNFTVISNNGDNYAFYNNDKTGLTFNNVWLTGGSFGTTKTKYIYCVGNNWINVVFENVLCDCGINDNGFAFYFVSNGLHSSNDLVFQNCFIDTVMATGTTDVGVVYMENCTNPHINGSLVRSGNGVNQGLTSYTIKCINTNLTIANSDVRRGVVYCDDDSIVTNNSSHLNSIVHRGQYEYYDNNIYKAVIAPTKHNRYNAGGGGSIARIYNGTVIITTDVGAVGTNNLIGMYYPYDADHDTHTFEITLPDACPFGTKFHIGVTNGTATWGFAVCNDYTNNGYQLELLRYDNASTVGAETKVSNWTGNKFIMRMVNDGTNVSFRISPDGSNWVEFRKVAISSMTGLNNVITGFLVGVDNYVSNGTPYVDIMTVNQTR